MRARQSISIAAPAPFVWDLVSDEYGGDLLSSSKQMDQASQPQLETLFSESLCWTVERVSDSECKVSLEAPVVIANDSSDHENNAGTKLDPVQTYIEALESLSVLCESIKQTIERTDREGQSWQSCPSGSD